MICELETPVTLREVPPGKALGVERCRRIVTDDATLSRRDFSRAAKAVTLGGVLGASRPLTGSSDPLSRSLLPKMPPRAIPGISSSQIMT